MENREKELLKKLAPVHPDLQYLWNHHTRFEDQLGKLERKAILNPEEEVQVKELKKQKLDVKTKMVTLIDQYAKKEG